MDVGPVDAVGLVVYAGAVLYGVVMWRRFVRTARPPFDPDVAPAATRVWYVTTCIGASLVAVVLLWGLVGLALTLSGVM